MMGRRGGDQASLFYEFRLDDRVPKDHLLRRIHVFVTAALADIHEQLECYYSEIGRPSVGQALLRRMLRHGISKYEPDPPAALKRAEQAEIEEELSSWPPELYSQIERK
jgi:hypothetical protein